MSAPTPRLTRPYLHLFLLLLAPPLILCVCALATLWIPLPTLFPPAMSGARNRVSAVLTGVLGLGYLVGLAAYLVFWVRRAASVLDPILTPEGLASKPHLLVGRHYRGMIEGRAIEITFLPAYGIVPALLNVTIGANLGVRMAVGRQRPRLDCMDCARVDVLNPKLKDLHVVAKDEASARRLLTSLEICAALPCLLTGTGTREVYVQPARIWLRARPRRMTAEDFARWLDCLEKLARAGERVLASSSR